jgi:hypothetical protein
MICVRTVPIILDRVVLVVQQSNVPLDEAIRVIICETESYVGSMYTFSPESFCEKLPTTSVSSLASGRNATFPYLTLVTMYLPVSSICIPRRREAD